MKHRPEQERRQLERFPVRAFTIIRILPPRSETYYELVTKDVSSGGAFFPLHIPLRPGDRIDLTLFLPPTSLEKSMSEPQRAKINTRGEVVRSDKAGVAVKFVGKYEISRAS